MMLSTPRAAQVFAYAAPVDLRKGYNGLVGLVANELHQDVLGGSLFLFVNRPRTGCKVLHWDGTGLCIFAKRLEGGRFATLWKTPPTPAAPATAVTLTTSELALFIEGCTLVGKQVLSPPPKCY